MRNGKYELIVAPEQYPGRLYRGRYAYEHHVVWWKKTGEVPPKDFEIHHINGNHRDNRIENLALLHWKEHARIHCEGRQSKVTFTCPVCEKEHTLKKSVYKTRLHRNKYRKVFCSSRCGTKHQHMVVCFGGARLGDMGSTVNGE